MQKFFRLLIIFCFISQFCNAKDIPQLGYLDKVRIREAIRIQQAFGESIWEGFTKPPFALILIKDSVEFLIHHPYPSADFKLSEKDSILKTDILYRKRTFPEYFLATFPAVNGVNCIVVGTPEKTNKHSSSWIVTLLHERFHQFQFSQPNYYTAAQALELSNGDETGMWQLNYPFPYVDVSINQQYAMYTKALIRDLRVQSSTTKKNAAFDFIAAKQQLKQSLSAPDYRYFSFQLWQEGIAKYTEFKFLEYLQKYVPSKDVQAIKDFIPFSQLKDSFLSSELESLEHSSLNQEKRVCFYAAGLVEGLLLDQLYPAWRKQYLKYLFHLDSLYSLAKR